MIFINVKPLTCKDLLNQIIGFSSINNIHNVSQHIFVLIVDGRKYSFSMFLLNIKLPKNYNSRY